MGLTVNPRLQCLHFGGFGFIAMELLDLTLPSPAENLALDEALLDWAEARRDGTEFLRLWESPEPLVVVGRTSVVEREVNVAACQERRIPILRRSSGGAAIVAGPGCLMYAVVLSYQRRPNLRMLDQAHAFVLGQTAAALRAKLPDVAHLGTSDLALGNLKFSGNSVRCKRHHFLYHGTLLYDFPLELVTEYLLTPPRQPAYRAGRSHEQFIANLPLTAAELRTALASQWNADPTALPWPTELTQQLVRERYGHNAWNFER